MRQNNKVPVVFRGKIKYLKPDLVEWVQTNITDPKETLEQAVERLYVEGIQEELEQNKPSTLDHYFINPQIPN